MFRCSFLAAGLLAATASLGFLLLDDPYGTAVTALNPGALAAGDPLIMLGPPTGVGPFQGSSDVYQLGVGGDVTLELGASAVDGPGTDLIVYENPFQVIGSDFDVWGECLFVEVSSDGSNFARFPNAYLGPPGPFGLFDPVRIDWYRGFAGVMPVMADPLAEVEPRNVVAGGGDAFDFADLAGHPLVLSEVVDLDDIRYVRLIDAVSDLALDDGGVTVYDSGGPASACADIDAVAAINTANNLVTGRPAVELFTDSGFVFVDLADSDGLKDIKKKLTASWNGVEFSFYSLLPFMYFLAVTPDRIVMAMGPFPPDTDSVLLKVGAEDKSGLFGGDAVYFP